MAGETPPLPPPFGKSPIFFHFFGTPSKASTCKSLCTRLSDLKASTIVSTGMFLYHERMLFTRQCFSNRGIMFDAT